MKFGVVIFPGSNCDRDMINALKHDMKQEVISLWHKDKDLSMFSPEDCLRCGAIARFSPMMQSVIEFANKGGKVLGVCNGFQILCESGLLPGVLLQNGNIQFVCKNIFITGEENNNHQVYQIPVAHGEGRYYIGENGLEDLQKNNQIIYRYCNEAGDVHIDYAPNGSLNGIAGICNKQRNIFGMMPHPERACAPMLGNTDGQKVFEELFSIN